VTASGAPTLVILAAGASSRFGRPKQLEPLGPAGEALLDYAIRDAARAGFDDAILVIGPDLEPGFRAHFARRPPALPVRYAPQDLSVGLPAGFDPPPERAKPWGTAHAVLAVRDLVPGPFAVVNADDFYGAGAYRAAVRHFAGADPSAGDWAMVAYRLDGTLSGTGGVSRGICLLDAAGRLTGLREVTGIDRKGDFIEGTDPGGTQVALLGDETVSMNFWLFTPRVFSVLSERFHAFLRNRGEDPKAEFLLPTVVGEAVEAGVARVHVLHAAARSFGVTFEADRDRVAAALAALNEPIEESPCS
jgi:hypothetical protein